MLIITENKFRLPLSPYKFDYYLEYTLGYPCFLLTVSVPEKELRSDVKQLKMYA